MTRWRKVLRDVVETPGRTALAIIAMAAGTFGIGSILTSYAILKRELASTYAATRPSTSIRNTASINDPNVLDAEERPVVRGRIRVGEGWAPLYLFVVRDFDDIRIDKFTRAEGAWPPRNDEVLLERTALAVAHAKIGDRVTMRIGSVDRELRVAGTVHAAGLAPAWMDHVVTGFISWTSIARIDERPQVRVIERGRAPTPHPHAAQMNTFLFLLGAFAALTLVLSAVLVANMIHALLVEQVRQVGVMKAIGATTRQIAGLYLAQVSMLAVVALAIGIPFGLAAGRAYARFSAEILNMNPSSALRAPSPLAEGRRISEGAPYRDSSPPESGEKVPKADEGDLDLDPPLWTFIVEVLVGILVPLAVALGPVVHASRITINEAFSNGVGRKPFGTRRFDRWLARVRGLPRPLMLSLRTTFHRRGRLILTVSTLAAGGAVFIAALNVSAGWSRIISDDAKAHRYDFEVFFAQPQPIARVQSVVPGEAWNETKIDGIPVIAVPPDTPLLRLPILEGRWLREDDRDAIVITQRLREHRLGSRIGRWTIVGVADEWGLETIYTTPRALPSNGTTRTLRIATHQDARDIERAFERAGIAVAHMQSLADRRKAIADHLVIIESALIFAALLVVLVGGLGLASTLTLNVVERTREIGILSAIGATPRTIARHVLVEGLLIGVLSFFVAMIVAAPATLALDDISGRMFHGSPLVFVMAPAALGAWLALVVVLAALSSFVPARRAAQMVVREAIAYE